CVRVQSNFDFW
nr:immunoglobulin heavy chain junction region [Macaca mulatta]MOV48390.1 immunoglobulin heavy chain junction region [Macaca mulatta]MOW86581.1 immunoglobulin heavy chain junction region [Macaca mulatta]MOW87290.1 immunoglobulin heavy chain junction region [Macaca mulatta]MOW87351.1 immunoglobulin heavy chain junction region [Macaca mulatta]